MPRGDAKIITIGTEARNKILEGAKKVSDAVAITFGPTSGNVGLQRSYGNATVTKDGVSVSEAVFLKDEIEDMGAGLLVEASRKSNDVSGDGTSCTCILGYHIMRLANQRIAAGYNPMALKRGIDKAAYWVKEEIGKLAKPIKDADLHEVAAISASDPAIGQLVADTITKVNGVGITVEKFDGLGIVQEMVDGVYFETGYVQPHFADPATHESNLANVDVLILEKRISSDKDIAPILEMIGNNSEHKKLLIIGTVTGKALETCVLTHIHPKGLLEMVVVHPPVYGSQVLPFLEDMAILTGATVINASMPANQVTYNMIGHAEKVVSTQNATTIFNGAGKPEDIKIRTDIIKDDLKSEKTTAFEKERMELRLAKLQGKIGIIKVGGATESEKDELKYRVDDAVHATRAAREEGIVPGGAVTLVNISKEAFSPVQQEYITMARDEQAGVDVVYEALREPFKQLMRNAGIDGGARLEKVLSAKPGYGFNVKKLSDEPIDLNEAKVFDPAKVIKSVVENACSAAGTAITMGAVVTFDRQYQLEQHGLNKARQ